MEPFLSHKGKVVTLTRANVDTDQMVPKQFLKRIERTGFGEVLFYDWRYLSDGKTPNPDFEMNDPRFAGATILLTRDNFGCGSSREHAVWAVRDYGLRVLIAPSFADIFYGNCINNGILPVTLPAKVIDELFDRVNRARELHLQVDLQSCTVTLYAADNLASSENWQTTFQIDAHVRNRLLKGLDNVGVTLTRQELIEAYEKNRQSYAFPHLT